MKEERYSREQRKPSLQHAVTKHYIPREPFQTPYGGASGKTRGERTPAGQFVGSALVQGYALLNEDNPYTEEEKGIT